MSAFDTWLADARAVRIEQVIKQRGGLNLRRVGQELVGPCPRCGGDDRFGVNIAKQVFNCRQCKATGDVIALVEHIDRCNFAAAVETLTGKPKPKANGKDRTSGKPRETVVAEFPYCDESGATIFAVERIEYRNADGTVVMKDGKHRKSFRQKRPDPAGGWIYNIEGIAPLLYRLPHIIEAIAFAHPIIVVEGEAKADLLWSWNMPATCCAMGAEKWRAEHSEFLRGVDVVILPDNDPKGRAHADVVGASLQDVAASVRVLELSGLPPKGDIVDWAKAGGTVERLHELIEQQAKPWVPNTDAADGWKYHDSTPIEPPRWLIKNILPETGVALIAGQWGCFKTTAALDLCLSAMSGDAFANCYRVKRSGGVCFIALEGGGALLARLSAIAEQRNISGPLPFAWRSDCPALTNKDAAEELCALIDNAALELRRKFSVPVVLIVVDTIIVAAQYSEGGDNDTASAQRVMNALRAVAQHSGAIVAGIDHFGKAIETGTRGSSAKEGAADTVLAHLADRELSGSVKNTRLAVRKQRDGAAGAEIPFTVRLIDRGTDEDGDPIVVPVIDWLSAQQGTPAEQRWTPSMQVLRRVLATVLVDHGQDITPFADGPMVRACDVELVRAEFYRAYPADGTEQQRSEVRRKQFKRSIRDAVERSLVVTRETGARQWIWFAKLEPAA
jgi:hypothetical protein